MSNWLLGHPRTSDEKTEFAAQDENSWLWIEGCMEVLGYNIQSYQSYFLSDDDDFVRQ